MLLSKEPNASFLKTEHKARKVVDLKEMRLATISGAVDVRARWRGTLRSSLGFVA